MVESEDRPLAEDSAYPVDIQPSVDYATPEGWNWHTIRASQPNVATSHMTHTDVTQVTSDVLRPSDSEPDAPFVITKDIPIIVIDSGDQYWAGESTTALPLQGLRVPVAGDTLEEAKKKLAADLAAQARLLFVLSSSHGDQLAPELKANLALFGQVLAPNPALQNQ